MYLKDPKTMAVNVNKDEAAKLRVLAAYRDTSITRMIRDWCLAEIKKYEQTYGPIPVAEEFLPAN